MMSFRLSSEAAGSGFPEKSSGDADNATDPKSPRDTPCGSRDKWQNKTHILSFNPGFSSGHGPSVSAVKSDSVQNTQPSADAGGAFSIGRGCRRRW